MNVNISKEFQEKKFKNRTQSDYERCLTMVWHEKFVESYIFFNLFVLSLIYKDKFVYKKKSHIIKCLKNINMFTLVNPLTSTSG